MRNLLSTWIGPQGLFSGQATAVTALFTTMTLAIAHQTAYGATLEEIEAVGSNWPGVELSLALDSPRGEDVVAIGDDIRYRLSGSQAGACYLLHLDKFGDATLMKPANCSAATADGGGFMTVFPEPDSLTVSAPLGTERVLAFLVDTPLPQTEAMLTAGQSFASLATQDAFDTFAGELIAAASGSRVATAELSYLVDSNQDNLQFTTRGIIRKVVEGTEAVKDTGNVVATFDVQSIQFNINSAELTDDSRAQLDAFGAALQSDQLEGIQLRIAGHTDDTGAADYNQGLSERRAGAVKGYFMENYQISDQRLSVQGLGESQPIAPNDSDQNRALNRRVEMLFVTD